MNNKPFYETRKKLFTVHVWNHPNFPIHLHKDLEFGYVTFGEMKAWINGEEKILHSGDCMLIFPNVIHSYESAGEVGLMLIIADMDYVGEFYNELESLEMTSPFFKKNQLSEIGQGILKLLNISAMDPNAKYESEKGMLMTLMSDIFLMRQNRFLIMYLKKNPAYILMSQCVY